MYRNDRSYDYGLRGAPQGRRTHFAARREVRYDRGYERRAHPDGRLANRITAPYTYDYVYGGRGERYPRNFNAYTGDRPSRMGGPSAYRQPYITNPGTRTFRGTMPPQRYDTPDYGPDYGGRYPDEL